MFRCSSTQLYVPTFSQKDFHYLVHTELPTQGTSTENFGQYNTGSIQLLSQPIQPLTRSNAQPTQNPPQQEGKHLTNKHLTLEGFQHKLHLSLKGAKHNLHLSIEGAKHCWPKGLSP